MPRVLIVDDSPSVRLLIRTNLELDGFEVDEVEDGVAALTFLRQAVEMPDVITLDVMMPRQSGLATAEAIRSDPRTHHIPVVMVTTQSTPVDIARGERAGVSAYIAKPFDPDDLVATVHRVLNRADRAPEARDPRRYP
jgi:CheY-like chemotaxis protein